MPGSETDSAVDSEQPVFASVQEECDYFRSQYESTVQKVEEIQAESQTLDELIETLNGLNQNLEESNEALEQRHKDDQEDIDALEKRLNVLEQHLAKTGQELDELKHKRIDEIKEHNATVGKMQRKIEHLEKEVEDRKQAIVKLEMGNDDLERSQRNALSSYLDLESKHNRILEEKILLEQDVEVRKRLEEDMQRLKDELRDQTLETAFLKSKLERAESEIKALSEQIETVKPSPAIRITKSQSSIALSTPPAITMRHAFMSPVQEQSIEESPSTFNETSETIKTGSGISPSQIPVARLKRLNSLSGHSPATPPLRRSNTIDSPRGSPQGRSPLSPSRHANSSNLNRSTNSRNIASMVSAGSPSRSRYVPTNRTLGTSTPLRPVALRNSSDASSVYAAKRQEISSKTAHLVARLQGISAAHKTVVRKTSGGFQRVAHGVASAISNGNNRLGRSASRQSDHTEQTGHAEPDVTQGDISTLSTNSPGSWVVIKDQQQGSSHAAKQHSTPVAPEPRISPKDHDQRLQTPGTRAGRPLPSRLGIPSPLSKPMTRSRTKTDLAAHGRGTRFPSGVSNVTATSSSTSGSLRPVTPVGDLRTNRPATPGLGPRDSGDEDETDAYGKPDLTSSTTRQPRSALLSPSLGQPQRPRSRQEQYASSRRNTRKEDLHPIPAPPGRIPGGVTRSQRRIEPPARSTPQQDLAPNPTIVQTRPRVSSRQTPARTEQSGLTVSTSSIPRRSISGRRPVSMSVVATEVPPMPADALAQVEAGRRAAGIGIGYPSSPHKTGVR
ncbi:hypothetical protein NliqN6_1404 [Naganishia liquefaciens]|uniref:NUDE domain-containing protein n=1 Tax=Naganishia liquefaciens TaxID=104408 RepID=A0A8H3YE85_9TREE|nr:hypothetical protein NliqN6_1404 [Naganishia liquefaciens]